MSKLEYGIQQKNLNRVLMAVTVERLKRKNTPGYLELLKVEEKVREAEFWLGEVEGITEMASE